MLPALSTIVTYPQGSVYEETKIVSVINQASLYPDKTMIITERTPFHPIDYKWPDQPADKGFVSLEGDKLLVSDVVVGAYKEGTEEIFWAEQIPVNRGEQGWIFLAAHAVSTSEILTDTLLETPVVLQVDSHYRNQLSAPHTGCHLMSLALNRRVSGYWRKGVRLDSLGNPNMDQLTIEKSTIVPNRSIDIYRIGKSIRKKGLDVASLFDSLERIQEDVVQNVREWVKTEADVSVESTSPLLEAARYWKCRLDNVEVRIPCGGTHISNLGLIKSINISFKADPQLGQLEIQTEVGGIN